MFVKQSCHLYIKKIHFINFNMVPKQGWSLVFLLFRNSEIIQKISKEEFFLYIITNCLSFNKPKIILRISGMTSEFPNKHKRPNWQPCSPVLYIIFTKFFSMLSQVKYSEYHFSITKVHRVWILWKFRPFRQ